MTYKFRCIKNEEDLVARQEPSAIQGQPPRVTSNLRRSNLKFLPADAQPGGLIDFEMSMVVITKNDEPAPFHLGDCYDVEIDPAADAGLRSVQ